VTATDELKGAWKEGRKEKMKEGIAAYHIRLSGI
jgi:hypothetical protein